MLPTLTPEHLLRGSIRTHDVQLYAVDAGPLRLRGVPDYLVMVPCELSPTAAQDLLVEATGRASAQPGSAAPEWSPAFAGTRAQWETEHADWLHFVSETAIGAVTATWAQVDGACLLAAALPGVPTLTGTEPVTLDRVPRLTREPDQEPGAVFTHVAVDGYWHLLVPGSLDRGQARERVVLVTDAWRALQRQHEQSLAVADAEIAASTADHDLGRLHYAEWVEACAAAQAREAAERRRAALLAAPSPLARAAATMSVILATPLAQSQDVFTAGGSVAHALSRS